VTLAGYATLSALSQKSTLPVESAETAPT